MKTSRLKNLITQYGVFYLTASAILLCLKLFYRNADSNDLQWILAPTAWWVRILSGISFENVPHIGYVNHDLRFIIARSCSGVQFMLITAAALIFSFLHRIVPPTDSKPFRRVLRGFGCVLMGFGLSYLLTILVNSMRIILSIYLPLLLAQSEFFQKCDIYGTRLTPDRLHTLIGTTVYFGSLLAIYQLMDKVTLNLSRNISISGGNFPKGSYSSGSFSTGNIHTRDVSVEPVSTPADSTLRKLSLYQKKAPAWSIHRLLRPAFWYFLFVLGIPLLNRAYANGQKQFMDYASLILFVCTGILVLFALPGMAKKLLS